MSRTSSGTTDSTSWAAARSARRKGAKTISPPANEPSVRGAFAWRVHLEPQKPVELKASYTIRIPSKLELVGGNRRES